LNLILAHGSPDDRHRRQVRDLALKVAERLAEPVEAGFLDGENLPAGSTVLPLFLGEGRHGRQDVVTLARESDCILLPSLACLAGEIAAMAADLAEKVSLSHCPVLFAIYRLRGFERLVSGLNRQRKRFPRMALASLHGLDCASILNLWRSEGVRHIVVQPAFLFHGHTMERLKTCLFEEDIDMDWRIGLPLAEHAEFPDLLAACFRKGDNREA